MNVQTAIGDVTQTLETLLRDHQSPKDWFGISLESPAEVKVSQTMKPQINLFLLHIRPNPMGHEPQWSPRGPEHLQAPPLALHLCYLVTPFAQNPLDQHRVLGTAMGIFHDFGLVEPDRLHGDLAHGNHALKIDLCTYSVEDQTNIWSALGSAYRTSVFYRIRVVYLDSAKSTRIRRAQTIETRAGTKGKAHETL